MSNFTTSWKFLEKLEEAGKLEFRQNLGRGELEASWELDTEPAGQAGTARRAGKICKILHKLETLCESNIYKLEPLTAKQIKKFKIIKFIFINKFLFLFNFKKIII